MNAMPSLTAHEVQIEPSHTGQLVDLFRQAWLPVSDRAACLDHDPELFFAESPADVERAKLVCHGCPVREVCLSAAKRRAEPHGVWGGELFVGGVVVARKRPRGRPRKTQIVEAA
ncbi:MAG TPA: WhiB family transcriptional regulator [Propionibacteriaceae bacterium]|nr:WhiB family transcriptional regulator [Propionibacteriaceae bacterium]